MPVNDMKSAVVLNMDARNVDTVMVAGKVVKRGGSLVGDLAKLNARLYQSRDRLYAEADLPLRSAPHRLSLERRIVEA
jgi:cytosine/adenosine deaminase-related metal-dependent hydrolase